MIFRNLTSDGDWTFGAGKAGYATAEKAIELNIKTTLLSWVGDCFFALTSGIDWRGRLEAGQQTALVEEAKSVILRCFGVVGIVSVDAVFDPESRNMSLKYVIQTIYSHAFVGQINQAAGTAG